MNLIASPGRESLGARGLKVLEGSWTGRIKLIIYLGAGTQEGNVEGLRKHTFGSQ